MRLSRRRQNKKTNRDIVLQTNTIRSRRQELLRRGKGEQETTW